MFSSSSTFSSFPFLLVSSPTTLPLPFSLPLPLSFFFLALPCLPWCLFVFLPSSIWSQSWGCRWARRSYT